MACIMLLLFCYVPIVVVQSTTANITDGDSLKQLLCNKSLASNTQIVVLNDIKLEILEESEFCLLESIDNISIIASAEILSKQDKYVEVKCVGTGIGFGFFNITDLTVSSVKFINCIAPISIEAVKFVNGSSQFLYYSDALHVSLFFSHCSNLKLHNMQVEVRAIYPDTTSMGLFGVNLCGDSVIINYEFDSLMNFVYFTDSDLLDLTVKCNLNITSSSMSDYYSGQEDNLVLIEDVFKSSPERITIQNYGNLALFLTQSFVVSVHLHLQNKPPQFPGPLQVNDPVYILMAFVNNINSSFVSYQGISHEFCYDDASLVTRALILSTVFYETPSFNVAVTDETVSNALQIKDTYFYSVGRTGMLQVLQFTKTLSHQVSIVNVSWCNSLYSISPSIHPLLRVENMYQEESANLYLTLNNLIMHKNLYYQNYIKSSSCLMCFENIKEISMTGTNYFAENLGGSVIRIVASQLSISGDLTVNDGHAFEGGGIHLDGTSRLFLVEPLTASFSHNAADKGSAIYAPIEACTTTEVSTIQVIPREHYSLDNVTSIDISLQFENNTYSNGQLAPSFYAPRFSIFGNQTSPGFLFHKRGWDFNNSQFAYTTFIDGMLIMETEDKFMSLANGLCVQHKWNNWECKYIDQNILNDGTTKSLRVYPGQIAFSVNHNNVDYRQMYEIKHCNYYPYSYWKSELTDYSTLAISILSQPEGDPGCLIASFSDVDASIHSIPIFQIQLESCPVGFCEIDGICVCDFELGNHSYDCNIDGPSITGPPEYWTGIDRINITPMIKFNNHCPPNYCCKKKYSAYLDLYRDPTSACLGNRTGDLCGECMDNYSMVFGSTDCYSHCTNLYLLTLPGYALAGVILVLLLFVLQLTVATGTINGLIFYANLLGLVMEKLSEDISSDYKAFVHVWVSVLNLDLGFPLCLYENMTTAAKVGFQFIFPTYLWSIIVVLIVLSKCSVRVTKLISNSSVQVLTTLFYLSFSKLLHTVIVVFSHSMIHSVTGCNADDHKMTRVWFYNGKEYGSSEHVVLLVLAVTYSLLFLLPYALLVTFSSCFVRFRLVNKFRPFIEAYGGPFKDKWRFWFGLRLWITILLFGLDGALKGTNSDAMFIVHTFIIMVFLLMQIFVRPFKNMLIGCLDASFIINYWLLIQIHTYTLKFEKFFLGVYIILTTSAFIVACLIVLLHVCALKYPNVTCIISRHSRKNYEPIQEKENDPDLDMALFRAAEERSQSVVVDQKAGLPPLTI